MAVGLAAEMSRQYNMYNVQLSEFWKQRCGKESIHNGPSMDEDDDDDASIISDAPSRAQSELSTASNMSRTKIEELEKKLHAERAYVAALQPAAPHHPAPSRAVPFQKSLRLLLPPHFPTRAASQEAHRN